MWEMNISVYPWGMQPTKTFKEVWNKIGSVLEDNGAENATLVYCPYSLIGQGTLSSSIRWGTSTRRYFPDDGKHVDYIGISAYSRYNTVASNLSFKDIAGSFINGMHKDFPDIPKMIAEWGKSEGPHQWKYIRDALNWIKKHPEVKAEIYWDNVLRGIRSYYDPHKLHLNSLEYLEMEFQNTYWIGGNKSMENPEKFYPMQNLSEETKKAIKNNIDELTERYRKLNEQTKKKED